MTATASAFMVDRVVLVYYVWRENVATVCLMPRCDALRVMQVISMSVLPLCQT
jgi:hypothetical protein